ncbi:hypothetical protein LJC60_08865 [Ruminococcaceae bacterium OttesenSCG-928-D13]|nr:hypothetical protein [Ruminococcaceae bacterium OttesenSCG-928-D13]
MRKQLKTVLLLLLCFCLLCPLTAYADGIGDGNIDGGGGNMGSGTSQSYWNSGNEGVRVTVVRSSDHAVVTTPIDLTNKTPNNIDMHFGKVSKISYTNGNGLAPLTTTYGYVNPAQSLPKIIATNSGSNNIEAIKSYFTDEQVIRSIANLTGMDFDVLVGGDYKLLLEPIAYFKFEGVDIAVTATEAALYDEVCSGLLRSKMASLSHKNLPLAMFLETSDLGYPAWSGSRSTTASNADIKSSLGLGIVRFEEQPEAPVLDTFDYEYRVNTKVVTSVWVSGGQSDPDRSTTVTFNIRGSSYRVSNVYYPSGDSQLVWVQWTTPAEPCEFTINVSVSGPGSPVQGTINVKVVDLDKNPPPNPVADDHNDSFTRASVPSREQNTSANWGVWRPWWRAYWVWHSGDDDDDGYWCDHGWWEFDFDRYSASLRATMSIKTDDHNPTASGRTMKSGYGINQTVTASVSSTQSSSVTPAQNAVSYFPEFRYEQFWRLLDRISIGGNSSQLEFQKNNYSTYKNRTHFTPIWYPDGAYTVNTWLIDCWTPTGMLSMNLTDSLTIRGSLWDDWHIAPLDPNH